MFAASDGAILGFVQHRLRRDTALVYLHGIESHAGWMDGPADMLCEKGYDVFCLDRRGSGINRENRGFRSGFVDSWATLVADIHAFVTPLRKRYAKVYLMGLSWGGKLALAHALTHSSDCDGLILITPGLRAHVDLTLMQKLGVGVGTFVAPTAEIAIPIEPEMFTKTPEFLDKMRRDPLRLHVATARFFMQSHLLDGYIDSHIAGNEVPVLLFEAGQDRIIDNEGVREVLEKGRQPMEILVYEDQTHSIQFDAPERLVADIVRWLRNR